MENGILSEEEVKSITRPSKDDIADFIKGKTIKMPYHDPCDEYLNKNDTQEEYKMKTKFANWLITDEGEYEFKGIVQ